MGATNHWAEQRYEVLCNAMECAEFVNKPSIEKRCYRGVL